MSTLRDAFEGPKGHKGPKRHKGQYTTVLYVPSVPLVIYVF